MEITSQLANQIAAAIYEVVKNDINLINQDGIVIGSTNPKRIGSFHGAGAQAIETGLPVVVTEDNVPKGTQLGINYPIFLEGAPIAAVGITGDPDEMNQFGFLITKISEVFLKEQQLNQELLSETRTLHFIISSLINGESKNFKRIQTLLAQYDLDPDGPFSAFTAKLTNPSWEQALRFYFAGIKCRLILYSYPNEFIAIIDKNSFTDFNINDFISKFSGKVHAGMGSFEPLARVHRSYENSKTARKHAQNHSLTLIHSEHISSELILENISEDMRRMYARNMLSSLTGKELQILKVYFSCNLSLKDASAALYIHKNTLQYQLDKISEKSGYNPRTFQDAFLLQLALLCS